MSHLHLSCYGTSPTMSLGRTKQRPASRVSGVFFFVPALAVSVPVPAALLYLVSWHLFVVPAAG